MVVSKYLLPPHTQTNKQTKNIALLVRVSVSVTKGNRNYNKKVFINFTLKEKLLFQAATTTQNLKHKCKRTIRTQLHGRAHIHSNVCRQELLRVLILFIVLENI